MLASILLCVVLLEIINLFIAVRLYPILNISAVFIHLEFAIILEIGLHILTYMIRFTDQSITFIQSYREISCKNSKANQLDKRIFNSFRPLIVKIGGYCYYTRGTFLTLIALVID